MSEIYREQLPNGLVLLGEPIASAQSLSMTWLTPAGLVAEPEDQQGVSTMLSEMICRGAGDLDARGHTEALDRLGVRRGSSAETRHLRVTGAMIGQKLDEALPLLTDMIRRPRLEAESLEPTRLLALQSLAALEDEPQQRVMLELKRQFYPQPLGRSPFGRREHVEAMTLEQIRDFWQRTCVPQGSILAFAGHFDWEELRRRVSELLGDWRGGFDEPVPESTPTRTYEHMPAETSQVHIGVAYDALTETDSDSVLQKAAAAVLSGGMSGRLFTEVREKRGLCYAVAASYTGQKDRGAMMGYAGTTTPRAQETLDVMTAELRRLSEGAEPNEFERAVVGMKSRLVMQGESTAARANAVASDQYTLGRPRTLDELAEEVDGVTLEKLNKFLAEHRPGEMSVVTLGPQPLKMEQAVG